MKTHKVLDILSGFILTTSGIVFSLLAPASASSLTPAINLQYWTWSYTGVDGSDSSGGGSLQTTFKNGLYTVTEIDGTSEGIDIQTILPLHQYPIVFGKGYNTNAFLLNADGGVNIAQALAWVAGDYRFALVERSGALYIESESLDLGQRVTFTPVLQTSAEPEQVPEPDSLIGNITLGSFLLGAATRKIRKRTSVSKSPILDSP